jgi:hypothetical protein
MGGALMNAARYREILAFLGWSYRDASELSGRNLRDVRGWAGKRVVPAEVGAWLESVYAIASNPPDDDAARPAWEARLYQAAHNPPPNPRKAGGDD